MFYYCCLILKFEKELHYTFQGKEKDLSKLYTVSLLTQLKECLCFTYILMVLLGTVIKDMPHVIQNQRHV